MHGPVASAPTGAQVQRQLQVGALWANRGKPEAVGSGRWKMNVTAPSARGTLTYRVVLLDRDGNVIARSSVSKVKIK